MPQMRAAQGGEVMATVESVVKEIFALWEENEKRLAENAALAARLDALTERVTETSLRISRLRDAYTARLKELAERVADLEKSPRRIARMNGEWVQGNGRMPADAYNTACTCGASGGPSEHHDKKCPEYIPF